MQPYILKGPVYNEDGEVVFTASRDIFEGDKLNASDFDGMTEAEYDNPPGEFYLALGGSAGYWQKRQVGG